MLVKLADFADSLRNSHFRGRRSLTTNSEVTTNNELDSERQRRIGPLSDKNLRLKPILIFSFNIADIDFMLELLKPPTDNWYKFFAILGLSLFVYSMVYSFNLDFEIKQKHLELQDKVAVAMSACGKIEDLRGNKGNAASDQKLIEMGDRLTDLSNDIQSKNRSLQFSNDTLQRNTSSAIVSLILGISMASTGFALWYTRVQKIQDDILKSKAALKTIEAFEDD